jgi:D-lactate dehydrogenase (cytochrome)
LRLAPLLPTKCAVVGFEGVEDAVGAATEMWVLFFLIFFIISVEMRLMRWREKEADKIV